MATVGKSADLLELPQVLGLRRKEKYITMEKKNHDVKVPLPVSHFAISSSTYGAPF